jgi:hypothetical protein
MPSKDFERTVQFQSVTTPTGEVFSFPIITVTLVQGNGNRVSLPLLFDTGASVTSLRRDLYTLLGLASWDAGKKIQSATAGGDAPADSYRYDGIILEVFGKLLSCPVHLIQMPQNPLFVGLLGRETIFQEFGFGFWESTKELHVTSTP